MFLPSAKATTSSDDKRADVRCRHGISRRIRDDGRCRILILVRCGDRGSCANLASDFSVGAAVGWDRAQSIVTLVVEMVGMR